MSTPFTRRETFSPFAAMSPSACRLGVSDHSPAPDHQAMVGKRLVSNEAYDAMSTEEQERAVPMRELPRVHRIILPGSAVQQDLCWERLNVILDGEGNIENTKMG